MIYKFINRKNSYEDLASGRVLYNFPGLTAFPARLADEITQRCFANLEKLNCKGPFILYDPCCGGGYLLATIGFLHKNKIAKIMASDYSIEVLNQAKRNLSLLQIEGLEARINAIKELLQLYNKDSHKQALESAIRLKDIIVNSAISIECSTNDITAKSEAKFKADIIITDLPYGDLTSWKTENFNPIEAFFSNIIPYLKPKKSILAVIHTKNQKLVSPLLEKIESFKVGKRQVSFFINFN